MAINPVDDRGTFDKIRTGNFSALDKGDWANTVSTGASTLAALGKDVPALGAIGTVAAGVVGSAEADKELGRIAEMFRADNVRQLVRQNPALRQKVKDLDSRWFDATMGTGVSIAGGAGGGALIGFFIPIPGATIAGSLLGGYLANKTYSGMIENMAQDPLIINMQIAKMQEAGEAVPPEVVFAALAANLSGKEGKRASRMLERHTGTKYFAEALADPDNIPKLRTMMNDPVLDDAIRAQTGMIYEGNNPYKTVGEQYADLMNSGHMQAKNMLNPGEGIYVKSTMAVAGKSPPFDVPVTPVVGMQEPVVGRNV